VINKQRHSLAQAKAGLACVAVGGFDLALLVSSTTPKDRT
jgi:hypothetical protein